MSSITVEEYHRRKHLCEGKCEIDIERIDEKDISKMPCVTCPFCKKIVTAELTPKTIHCPACKVTVKR